MALTLFQNRTAPWRSGIAMHAALLTGILLSANGCFAQKPNEKDPASRPATDQKPLSNDERAELLKLIRSLQERVERLEAARATPSPSPSTESPAATGTKVGADAKDEPVASSAVPATPTKSQDSDDKKFDGRYTPNLGFRLANTEYGDLNVSIYTYVRYLNQRALNSDYTDAFGNV